MTARAVRIVFQRTANLTDDELASAAAMLSPNERERRARFRFADDARDYVAAHALLRAELSRGTSVAPGEWPFDISPNGKPRLSDDAPRRCSISLSHAPGLVACAIGPADVSIGVDVESTERVVDVDRLADRFFAADEAAALRALPAQARRSRFFDLWTLKEAATKAAGSVLPSALATITVAVDDVDEDSGRRLARVCSAPGDPDESAGSSAGRLEWQSALFTPVPGYRLAVAVVRAAGRVPVEIAVPADVGACTGTSL